MNQICRSGIPSLFNTFKLRQKYMLYNFPWIKPKIKKISVNRWRLRINAQQRSEIKKLMFRHKGISASYAVSMNRSGL